MFDDFTETMTRGDSHPIRFTVEINQVPQDITDWSKFWFTAKRRPSDADAAAIIALTTPTDIAIIDAPNGVLEVRIQPSHTSTIAAGTHLRLVADLQGRDPNDDLFTLAKGVLVIEPDATIAAT